MRTIMDAVTYLGVAYCVAVLGLCAYALIPSHRHFRGELAKYSIILAGLLFLLILVQRFIGDAILKG